jgi:hypothetical protein
METNPVSPLPTFTTARRPSCTDQADARAACYCRKSTNQIYVEGSDASCLTRAKEKCMTLPLKVIMALCLLASGVMILAPEAWAQCTGIQDGSQCLPPSVLYPNTNHPATQHSQPRIGSPPSSGPRPAWMYAPPLEFSDDGPHVTALFFSPDGYLTRVIRNDESRASRWPNRLQLPRPVTTEMHAGRYHHQRKCFPRLRREWQSGFRLRSERAKFGAAGDGGMQSSLSRAGV